MSDDLGAVAVAGNNAAARRCYPLFAQLRTHLTEAAFLAQWREQAASGYELVYVEHNASIVAVAGFRELTTMAWGRILYLDDLIADTQMHGRGYGTLLLRYLQDQTVRRRCTAMHLDTGFGRHAAHTAYLRNGFKLSCHHLAWTPGIG